MKYKVHITFNDTNDDEQEVEHVFNLLQSVIEMIIYYLSTERVTGIKVWEDGQQVLDHDGT